MIRALFCLAAASVSFSAAAQMSPVGLWKSIDYRTNKERSIIRVVEVDGVLHGKVEKTLYANARVICDNCPGELKGKPFIGMTVISGLKRKLELPDPTWTGGKILDPDEGRLYDVFVKPEDGGKKLMVRGYVGTPALGRTQYWIRIE